MYWLFSDYPVNNIMPFRTFTIAILHLSLCAFGNFTATPENDLEAINNLTVTEENLKELKYECIVYELNFYNSIITRIRSLFFIVFVNFSLLFDDTVKKCETVMVSSVAHSDMKFNFRNCQSRLR